MQTQFADSISSATWYCTRAGSDTCIVPSSQFQIGDTFYIVVSCRRQCTYDIRSYYVSESILPENSKTAFRWNGTSTEIISYYVPAVNLYGVLPSKWQITIDPEAPFQQF
jgi:hypothetical protein